MKIAITNAFLPSEEHHGVPYQVHYLANTLVDRGHDVTVFTFSPPPADARYVTVQYPRPPVPRRFFPFFMAFRLSKTDFSDFDAVNMHGDNYLVSPKHKHVRTFHGAAKDELRNAKTFRRRAFFLITSVLESIGARVATVSIGVSETTRRAFPKIEAIIPCGVNLDDFHSLEKSTHPTVFFVGTEGGRKRGAWLAKLFSDEVLPFVPDAELIMVTDYVGTEPGVTRLGRVSKNELSARYGAAWLFCLPSTYEGFGVPFIEAMASNTATIATSQNPGAAEILGAGKYGALVNDAQLAPEIRALLLDSDRRQKYAIAGLERSKSFSWHNVAAEYEKMFASLAAR